MDSSEELCVLTAFKSALKANGEHQGGMFERRLLSILLREFPLYKEKLLQVAIDWTRV